MMEAKPLRFITHQAFFSAVRSGDLECLKQLLDKLTKNETSDGSSSSVSDLMKLQNDAGETALYIAADNNLQEIFSYLIRFCGVEIVKIRSKSDLNTFHVAAKRGHLGMIFLIQ